MLSRDLYLLMSDFHQKVRGRVHHHAQPIESEMVQKAVYIE
jgi:hypothetical protein